MTIKSNLYDINPPELSDEDIKKLRSLVFREKYIDKDGNVLEEVPNFSIPDTEFAEKLICEIDNGLELSIIWPDKVVAPQDRAWPHKNKPVDIFRFDCEDDLADEDDFFPIEEHPIEEAPILVSSSVEVIDSSIVIGKTRNQSRLVSLFEFNRLCKESCTIESCTIDSDNEFLVPQIPKKIASSYPDFSISKYTFSDSNFNAFWSKNVSGNVIKATEKTSKTFNVKPVSYGEHLLGSVRQIYQKDFTTPDYWFKILPGNTIGWDGQSQDFAVFVKALNDTKDFMSREVPQKKEDLFENQENDEGMQIWSSTVSLAKRSFKSFLGFFKVQEEVPRSENSVNFFWVGKNSAWATEKQADVNAAVLCTIYQHTVVLVLGVRHEHSHQQPGDENVKLLCEPLLDNDKLPKKIAYLFRDNITIGNQLVSSLGKNLSNGLKGSAEKVNL